MNEEQLTIILLISCVLGAGFFIATDGIVATIDKHNAIDFGKNECNSIIYTTTPIMFTHILFDDNVYIKNMSPGNYNIQITTKTPDDYIVADLEYTDVTMFAKNKFGGYQMYNSTKKSNIGVSDRYSDLNKRFVISNGLGMVDPVIRIHGKTGIDFSPSHANITVSRVG